MDRGQRIALATGGGLILVGVGGMLWRWQSAKKKELPPPQDLKPPPYGWQPGFKLPVDPNAIYAALVKGQWVEDLGGGWVMLDATAIRDSKLDPDRDAHVGMIASLILSNKGAPPKVFLAQIIGISGDDYNGTWRTQPPSGGPQMIDFRGANIYTLHK